MPAAPNRSASRTARRWPAIWAGPPRSSPTSPVGRRERRSTRSPRPSHRYGGCPRARSGPWPAGPASGWAATPTAVRTSPEPLTPVRIGWTPRCARTGRTGWTSSVPTRRPRRHRTWCRRWRWCVAAPSKASASATSPGRSHCVRTSSRAWSTSPTRSPGVLWRSPTAPSPARRHRSGGSSIPRTRCCGVTPFAPSTSPAAARVSAASSSRSTPWPTTSRATSSQRRSSSSPNSTGGAPHGPRVDRPAWPAVTPGWNSRSVVPLEAENSGAHRRGQAPGGQSGVDEGCEIVEGEAGIDLTAAVEALMTVLADDVDLVSTRDPALEARISAVTDAAQGCEGEAAARPRVVRARRPDPIRDEHADQGEWHHVPDVPGCHEGDLVLANTEEPTLAQLTVPAALEGDGNEGDGDVGRACGHHA